MEEFLEELASFISATGQLDGATTTQTVAEDTVHKLESYLNVFAAILRSLEADDSDPEVRQLISLFNDLNKSLENILLRWLDIEMGIDPDSPHIGLKAEKEQSGGRGRPKYIIRREQLLFLRDLRFTCHYYNYGVSRRTLYNIRSDLGLTEPNYSNFTTMISKVLFKS